MWAQLDRCWGVMCAMQDGNLGLRGIAYFFRSHQCNPLCARLNLKPFTRCPADVKAQVSTQTMAHLTHVSADSGL